MVGIIGEEKEWEKKDDRDNGQLFCFVFVFLFPSIENTLYRLKQSYADIRAKQNITRLQEELMDVSHIMTTNIKDVLERGSKLERMSLMSDTLAAESKKYLKEARQVNLDAMWRQYGTPSILVVIVLFALWIWIKFL